MKKLLFILLLIPVISNAQFKLEYKAANLQIIFDDSKELKITLDTTVSYSGYFNISEDFILINQYDNLTKLKSTFELLSKEIDEENGEITYSYIVKPNYNTMSVIYSIDNLSSLWVCYDVSENISHIVEYKIYNTTQIRKPRHP